MPATPCQALGTIFELVPSSLRRNPGAARLTEIEKCYCNAVPTCAVEASPANTCSAPDIGCVSNVATTRAACTPTKALSMSMIHSITELGFSLPFNTSSCEQPENPRIPTTPETNWQQKLTAPRNPCSPLQCPRPWVYLRGGHRHLIKCRQP